MAFCTNCGNELKDGTKFCSKCGKPATVQRPQNDLSETSSNYSIDLVSVASGREYKVNKAIMGLLKIELFDAIKIADSAPCSLATGLSLSKAEMYAQKMENAGAVIIMKNNGVIVPRTIHPQMDEMDNEDLGCFLSALSFFIPIIGFFIFGMNWRQKPKVAENALLSGLMGIFLSTVISVILLISYWDGYCRLIQIITGKY